MTHKVGRRPTLEEMRESIERWEKHKKFVQEASKDYSQNRADDCDDYRQADNAAPDSLPYITPTGNFSLASKGNLIAVSQWFYHSVFTNMCERIIQLRRFISGKKQVIGNKIGVFKKSKDTIETK